MLSPPESNSGLAAALRGVVADMQHASGAEIVSIFLYEESSHTYYAPFATGQPQESLLDSLTDMRGQLARYLDDAKEGKVPDELNVHQYGSTVWLTVTRRRLVARNAPSEIDSTFIRRYQVQVTIGLPLLAGDRLLGLVYLNYRTRDNAPDDSQLKELERRTAAAAEVIQAVLAGADRAALEGLTRLTTLLTAPVGDARTSAKELRRLLSIALADLLMASNLDGAVLYQFAPQRTTLELVTAHLRVAAPARIERADQSTTWEAALNTAIGMVTAEADLHPVATYGLGNPGEPHGYLVVLSRDQLAAVRRAASTDELLQAGAELIGGALASQRLIADLENSNRLLSALGDMTSAMLQPGASRHQVIDSVVGHLTDSEVPEFDFNFASVYLLDAGDDQTTVVRMAAGAATAAAIDAAETSKGTGPRATHGRVPRWALEEDRVLAGDDVLVYVAQTWQPAIVGPLPARDHADVIAGGIPVPSTWVEVPVVYSNGTVLGHVLACLVGEAEQRGGPDAPPFTLAGEVFERGGHKDLIRIFVPFGS
ncbi:MAG TPA: GAF domain-containing protein, partial [Chloroflexota bacterium]